jgi:hypothetical protein
MLIGQVNQKFKSFDKTIKYIETACTKIPALELALATEAEARK